LVNNKPICADCPEGEIFNGTSCVQKEYQCLQSQECSTNCDNKGICLGNCSDGWTGERCTDRCNEKCLICSKNDRNICIQCTGNFYTNSCSLACRQSCKVEEDKNTCAFDDGYCLNGCERDYWGNTCNNSCPVDCLAQGCDRSTGTCMAGCSDGYSGDKCGPITTTNHKGYL
jgi:hypothetical protein